MSGLSFLFTGSTPASIKRRRCAHCLRREDHLSGPTFVCVWYERHHTGRHTDVHSSTPLRYKTVKLNLQSQTKVSHATFLLSHSDLTFWHNCRFRFNTYNSSYIQDLESLVVIIDARIRHRRLDANASLVLRLIYHMSIMSVPDDVGIA